nr:hypothetical protein [Rhizobium sullae]
MFQEMKLDFRALRHSRGIEFVEVGLHADLGRRVTRLLVMAPAATRQRADMMVAILISEDTQSAKAGTTTSDCSSRRLDLFGLVTLALAFVVANFFFHS